MVSPRTEVLILTMHCSDHLIREIVDTAARGYILKSDSARDLAIAIETLANHKPFFTPDATEVILRGFNSGGSVAEVPDLIRDQLTPGSARLFNCWQKVGVLRKSRALCLLA